MLGMNNGDLERRIASSFSLFFCFLTGGKLMKVMASQSEVED